MLDVLGRIGRRAAVASAALLLAIAAGPGLAGELLGHGGPVRSIAAGSDGTLVSGGFDNSVMLWQLDKAATIRRIELNDAAVNAVARAADGTRIVAGSDDGTVVIVDAADGRLLHRIELGTRIAALDIIGPVVAAGGWDGRIHLLRLEDGDRVGQLGQGSARITTLRFLSDERLLSGGHDGALRLWNVRTGKLLAQRAGTGAAATDSALLPDRQSLVVTQIDGHVRLLRSEDLSLDGELGRHDGPVMSVAVRPDGRQIATGDVGGRIVLWDMPQRQLSRVLTAHSGAVWDLAYAAASRSGEPATLVSAGGDGVLRAWRNGEQLREVEPMLAAGPGAMVDAHGARLFRACIACHTVTPDGGNRAGPTLYGLFGRPAGSVPDYSYSPALRDSGIVWTETTLARLMEEGPDRFTPGSKMPLQQMPGAADRAALVAYLKAITGPDATAR